MATLPAQHTGNVRSLKRQLAKLHGHPRFREKIMLARRLPEDHMLAGLSNRRPASGASTFNHDAKDARAKFKTQARC